MKLKEARSYSYKEFIKMDKSKQKEIAQTINKTVSRRINNLKKINADSYAVSIYNRSGGVQSVRGQNTYALWRSVSRGNKFLDMQTSSVKGYKKLLSDTADRMLIPEYKTMTNEERTDFWRLYNEIQETGFFEELRARDLSSDYIQTLVYELHESGYTVEDTQTAIDIMREEFGVYDTLHMSEMENF